MKWSNKSPASPVELNGHYSLADGIFKKNTVFASGLVIAPLVVVGVTIKNTLALIFVFTFLTFFTILLSSVVSRSLAYAIRIILYTLIGSVVYIPITICANMWFPVQTASLGIYVPLLITNSLIVSKADLRFLREPRKRMVLDCLSYIIGFDLAALIFGFIRELVAMGMVGGQMVGIPLTFPALALPFGGFILLGLLSALYRKIISSAEKRQNRSLYDEMQTIQEEERRKEQ